MTKRDAPATHRNREPILEVLARWLPKPARVLEIASGTGQHAVFFAEELPHLDWHPSDQDESGLDSIRAWVAESGLSNLHGAVAIDVSRPVTDWPVTSAGFDAVFNANMIHIAPWAAALGLFAGAAGCLSPGGRLFLYGPFKVGGEHTSPSNVSFDAGLREQDPLWGIRDLEEVTEVAASHSFTRIETNEMPANNKLLVFEKAALSV